MAQVENILLNAKSGQFVVASCPGSKSDLNGYVVNLNQNDIQTVKIENWESGWPYEMDLYKVNYICNKEEEKTIKIKENFTTKVGIQVEKNGEKVELNTDNVTLKDNDITISADSVYNGYVTFPISTGDCGDDKVCTLSCEKIVTDIDENIELTASGTTATTVRLSCSLSDLVGKELKADSFTPLSGFNYDSDGNVMVPFIGIRIFSKNETVKYTWLYPYSQTLPKTVTGWYKPIGGWNVELIDTYIVEEGDYLFF